MPDVLCRLATRLAARDRHARRRHAGAIRARDDPDLRRSVRKFPDMFPQSFEHDSNIYLSHLTRAAAVIAQDMRSRMWHVERRFYWRYFLRVERNPTPDPAEIWRLIRAMRSWAVHVSGLPFVMLEDDRPELRAAFPQDEYWHDHVDRRPDHWGNPPEVRLSFHAWRGIQRSEEFRRSDPRGLAVSATGVFSDELKQHLYQSHPILLLLPKVAVHPSTILHVLRLPKHEAIAHMTSLIRSAARPLQRVRNRFRAETQDLIDAVETNRLPGDTNWNRLSPIVRSAAIAVLGSTGRATPDPRMIALAHDLLEATSPISPQDIVFYSAIALTAVVTVMTLGAGIPLSSTASLALVAADLTLVGAEIYLTAAENAVRGQLNSLVHVDAALEVAGPEKDVSADILITAVSFLVPFALGATARRVFRRMQSMDLPGSPPPVTPERAAARETPVPAPARRDQADTARPRPEGRHIQRPPPETPRTTTSDGAGGRRPGADRTPPPDARVTLAGDEVVRRFQERPEIQQLLRNLEARNWFFDDIGVTERSLRLRLGNGTAAEFDAASRHLRAQFDIHLSRSLDEFRIDRRARERDFEAQSPDRVVRASPNARLAQIRDRGSNSASAVLGQRLEAANELRPEASFETGRISARGVPIRQNIFEAHHIVQWIDDRAQVARDILQKYGIDLNDPRNGVWLPNLRGHGAASVRAREALRNFQTPQGASHEYYDVHNPNYLNAINRRLSAADARGETAVLAELATIKRELSEGRFHEGRVAPRR